MKQRVHFFTIGIAWGTPAFFFMIIFFLCGALAGGFTGILARTSPSITQLASYLISSSQAEISIVKELAVACASSLAWIVLCLVAGFLTPPSLFIGFTVALRGFLLSLFLCVMVIALGFRGFVLSLATRGIGSICAIPCLILCATIAYAAACERPQSKRSAYLSTLQRHRSTLLLCTLLTLGSGIICVIASRCILPLLG